MVARSGGKGFHPDADMITMIVDSGASDHLVDDELITRLRDSMNDYNKLKEPKIIVTAGSNEVIETATGTTWGYTIDQAGQRVPVRISVIIVPGWGQHLLRQSNELGSKHHPQDGKPPHTVQQQQLTSAEPAR